MSGWSNGWDCVAEAERFVNHRIRAAWPRHYVLVWPLPEPKDIVNVQRIP